MPKKIKKSKKDTIGYSGKLEIGVVINGKRHKKLVTNSGKQSLFEFVRDCLAGRGNVSKRPGQIKLYDGSTALTSYGIGFNDISIGAATDNEASIKLYFLIPGTIILNRSINKAELLSVDGASTLAEASMDSSITVSSIDTNLYVIWTLTIRNA